MSIEELKELQLKIIKKSNIINKIFTIIALIILYFIIKFLISEHTDSILIIISCFIEIIFFILIAILIKVIIISKDINIFHENCRSIFVLDTLKKFLENVIYDPKKGFDKSFIEKMEILNINDKYDSNDFISGTYKNINFEQADFEIKEKNKDKDIYISIFKGKIMIFDFNRSFKTNLIIVSNDFEAFRLSNNKNYSKVLINDEEVNEKFSVYAENQYDALNILTPHFIESLKVLNEKMDSEMMITFIDNKLYIAIDNSNEILEWNVYEIIDEQKIEENITNDIKIIGDFISNLNLDNDCFIN